MHAYSLDLRQRVLDDRDRRLTTRAAATNYSISESWVRRLKQRRRLHGDLAPRMETFFSQSERCNMCRSTARAPFVRHSTPQSRRRLAACDLEKPTTLFDRRPDSLE